MTTRKLLFRIINKSKTTSPKAVSVQSAPLGIISIKN